MDDNSPDKDQEDDKNTDYGKYMPGLYKYMSDKSTADSVEPESDPATTLAGVALAGPALAGIKAAAPLVMDTIAPAVAGLASDEAGTAYLGNLKNMIKGGVSETPAAQAPTDVVGVGRAAQEALMAPGKGGYNNPDYIKAMNLLSRLNDQAKAPAAKLLGYGKSKN